MYAKNTNAGLMSALAASVKGSDKDIPKAGLKTQLWWLLMGSIWKNKVGLRVAPLLILTIYLKENTRNTGIN